MARPARPDHHLPGRLAHAVDVWRIHRLILDMRPVVGTVGKHVVGAEMHHDGAGFLACQRDVPRPDGIDGKRLRGVAFDFVDDVICREVDHNARLLRKDQPPHRLGIGDVQLMVRQRQKFVAGVPLWPPPFEIVAELSSPSGDEDAAHEPTSRSGLAPFGRSNTLPVTWITPCASCNSFIQAML